MIFYLTFPDYNAPRRLGVPLFVNRRAFFGSRGPRCMREGVSKGMTPAFRKACQKYRAISEWCLDSGGYTVLSDPKNDGRWPISEEQYVAEVRWLLEHIGGLSWAAAMDHMTEDTVLQNTERHWSVKLNWAPDLRPSTERIPKTHPISKRPMPRAGLRVVDDEESDELVRIHQELTIDNYLRLRRLGGKDLEHIWLPVIQGRNLEQYERHVRMYLIHGIDLRQANSVGVGSVCRMGREDKIAEVFARLNDMGLYRLHGFGLKRTALPMEQMELVTAPDTELRELYRVGAEAGLDVYDLEVRLPGLLDQTAWDSVPTQVCNMIRSADSNAWSLRANIYSNDVRRARDKQFGGRGSWAVRKGGVIYDKRTGAELGRVDPSLAGMSSPTWNAPTQISRECAVLSLSEKIHESCNSCVSWALEWRDGLRSLLEPLGCWHESPPFRTLPAPPYFPPELRAQKAVERLKELGLWPPGPPPPTSGPQLTLWNPYRRFR